MAIHVAILAWECLVAQFPKNEVSENPLSLVIEVAICSTVIMGFGKIGGPSRVETSENVLIQWNAVEFASLAWAARNQKRPKAAIVRQRHRSDFLESLPNVTYPFGSKVLHGLDLVPRSESQKAL